jgi:hypothetical protein
MSGANLSADKIREMLAEANGRLRKASAEYFDLLEKASQGHAGRCQDPVRILPGPDALTDRPCKEHGRVRHEGGDRRFYPKELKAAARSTGVLGGTLYRSQSA